MQSKILFYITLYVCSMFSTSVLGQSNTYFLDKSEGLSQGTVTSIVEDQFGYSGLVRLMG